MPFLADGRYCARRPPFPSTKEKAVQADLVDQLQAAGGGAQDNSKTPEQVLREEEALRLAEERRQAQEDLKMRQAAAVESGRARRRKEAYKKKEAYEKKMQAIKFAEDKQEMIDRYEEDNPGEPETQPEAEGGDYLAAEGGIVYQISEDEWHLWSDSDSD
eukprot:SAG22_NODE_560_length_9102_cov_54.310785_3_plen_160_part_00